MPADPTRPFDSVGAVLSAAAMSFLVIGILQAGNNNTLLVVFFLLAAVLTVLYPGGHGRHFRERSVQPSRWHEHHAS